ncbi:MAG: hypothetical protein HY689_13615 [Chloroflexi bacterium]|nr:hypothetical protein [Chloroflexota bacterium]
MPIDRQWIEAWFFRLDQGLRHEAINDLRTATEEEVVRLNRVQTERAKEFARIILEIYAFLITGQERDDLEQRFQQAQELERQLRELEEAADRARRDLEAFEHVVRFVNRMR